MKTKTPLLLAGLLVGAACAAEESPHQRLAELHKELSREIESHVRVALADEAMHFAGRELQGERVVKGAPYCASAVHETVQALADGNRIVKAQRTELCRDGEGRTRREIQREGGDRVVYLNDPVAKESWVLRPEQKSARRLRTPMSGPMVEQELRLRALSDRMRENAERWREWAAKAAQQARQDGELARKEGEQAAKEARAAAKEAREARKLAPRAGEPAIIINEDVVVRGDGEPERRREVRVIRLSDMPAMAPMPPMPPMPAMPAMAFGWSPAPMLPRGGGTTTALPAREIEGLKVNGERTTWTIEAGKIGNEKPIVSSREVWTSPELMLTVLSKDVDPRRGETSYRLEKIRRGEPDAALMRVPADYQREQPRQPAAPRAPSAPATPKPPAKG